MGKRTLIMGATDNPGRYAYIAAMRLTGAGHPIVLFGIKKGNVNGQPILNEFPAGESIDTITLYIGPDKQPQYYDAMMQLKPKRIIFNPGTENSELAALARKNGVEPVIACTLVMLGTGEY